jgi:stage V sporulation protein S
MSDKTHGLVEDFIKVSGSSHPQSVGSIMARAVIAGHTPHIRAIGASAVYLGAKACAIARGFVAPRGIDLSFVIGFSDITAEDGQTISAIIFKPVVR